MKKLLRILPALLVLLISSSLIAQKYKTAADTLKLNKDISSVNKDIADLTLKLAEANNNLPNYREKVRSAEEQAQKTSDQSSNSADKATNGDVGDAKKAKKNASKAYGAAKDVISANDKVKNEEKH